MHSLRTTLMAVLAAGLVAPVLADDPAAICYSTVGTLKSAGINTYQTQGLCHDQCAKMGKAVYAVTKGSTCYCGDSMPSTGKVAKSECNIPCQGYPQELCGGLNTFLFGLTGVSAPDSSASQPSSTSEASSSSTGSTTSSDIPAVQTVIQGSTATVTAAISDAQPQSGGTSKAGIAAGVVVGVIALIALGVGGFLVVRRNRRRQAEEEYRAAVAAKEFTASIRKPQSDARLDPVMLQHRRMSDGSIADNEDYSRRILKVTNPDDA
ncbi:hypothetical protein TWF696_000765 [Orbilia brochopaga]|uniref:WSC domain-containing protein n=1 Tax=Orbilia brochopaga TaxID=3140254 RepID=A0AAV9VFU1_9PEZI